MSTPWIEEPETGRWYITTQDQDGRIVRRYSEELSPTSLNQTNQPAAYQYSQFIPRSEINGNLYPISSSGLSGTRDQIYGSESSRGSPGMIPGTYQASSQAYTSSAVDGFNTSNINSMMSRFDNLAVGDLDRDAQNNPTAPGSRQWGPGPSSLYAPIPSQQHPSGSHRFDRAPPPANFEQGYSSQNKAPRHISGTEGETEQLDPKYRVRNHDYTTFFREGRVFKTLWTDAASKQTNRDQTFISTVTYGEKVHSKIRRFVVVRQRDKKCICLPVTSYKGRGYKKSGIDLSEHSQIYSNKPPKPVRDITKKSLKINLSKDADYLNNQSLINYGSPYTVECNVKVRDIGVLDSESLKILLRDYNKVHYRHYDYSDDATMDNQPQRKDQDLAFVGTSFTPNSSSAPGGSAYTASSGFDQLGSGNIKSRAYTAGGYRPPVQGQSSHMVDSGYDASSSYYSSNVVSGTNARSGRSGSPDSSSTYPAPANPGYSSRPTTPLEVSSLPTTTQSHREAGNEREENDDEEINLPSREEIQASRSSRSRRESVSKPSRSSGKDGERDHHRDRHRKRR